MRLVISPPTLRIMGKNPLGLDVALEPLKEIDSARIRKLSAPTQTEVWRQSIVSSWWRRAVTRLNSALTSPRSSDRRGCCSFDWAPRSCIIQLILGYGPDARIRSLCIFPEEIPSK